MNHLTISAYFHKYGSFVNSTTKKFREIIHVLQTRLNDFSYFHDIDENDEYADITQKSIELYQDTEKINTKALSFLSSNDDKIIICRDDIIDYIGSVYKSIKDENSIYSKLQKEIKELYQKRNPDDFSELFTSYKDCLKLLGIQLNIEEEKLFKKKITKFFGKELETENTKEDINFELSEEKENIFGQAISEICLCISIKLFKKSKSTFKTNLKKIDKAFKAENESFCLSIINQIFALQKENSYLKEANNDYSTKLNNSKEENDELQNLLNEKNEQIKKLSDKIMQLEGTPSSPDILFKVEDYSDDIDDLLNYEGSDNSSIQTRDTLTPSPDDVNVRTIYNTNNNDNSLFTTKKEMLTLPYAQKNKYKKSKKDVTTNEHRRSTSIDDTASKTAAINDNATDNNTADNNNVDNDTTDNNTADNNITNDNIISDNITDKNVTDKNATDKNATDKNATDNNITDNNATDNNIIDNNATNDNATDTNSDDNNITNDSIIQQQKQIINELKKKYQILYQLYMNVLKF